MIVVAMNLCVGPNEGVLRDFFGAGRLTDHHQHEPEQPALIRLHEASECLAVAAPDVMHDVPVRGRHAPGCSASSTRPNPIDAYTSLRPP